MVLHGLMSIKIIWETMISNDESERARTSKSGPGNQEIRGIKAGMLKGKFL